MAEARRSGRGRLGHPSRTGKIWLEDRWDFGVQWQEGNSLLSVELNKTTRLTGWVGAEGLLTTERGNTVNWEDSWHQVGGARTRVANTSKWCGWRPTMRNFRKQPRGSFRKTKTWIGNRHRFLGKAKPGLCFHGDSRWQVTEGSTALWEEGELQPRGTGREKRAGKEAGYLRRRKISLQRERGAKKGVSYPSCRPH